MGARLIADLDITTAQFGTMVGAVAAGNVLLLSASGYVADRLDPRRVLAAATAACGLATLALALTSLYGVLLALLVAVGMAVAATISAGGGAVFAAAPPQWRGLSVSIRQTGLPVGGILAALIVPPLLRVGDWRSVFLVERDDIGEPVEQHVRFVRRELVRRADRATDRRRCDRETLVAIGDAELAEERM
ncbi:MAG: MFS transporter, partial [Actinophytocola sp.]|nr:MFS transporter [Actinophytocola sp.]